MKKIAAFLMVFALCVMCFGAYGFAADSHTVHAADDLEIGTYLYLNQEKCSVVYSELTRTLSVTLSIESESIERGERAVLKITTPYYVLGKPTVSGSVFGDISPEITTSTTSPVSGAYSEITFSAETEDNDNGFLQSGFITIQYPVDVSYVNQFSWLRQVRIGISATVVTQSGQTIGFEGGSVVYDAYICNHSQTGERTAKEPTCTSAGEKQTYCLVCNYVLGTNVIFPTNHNLDYTKPYNQYLNPYIAPTCKTTGSGSFKCKDCGEIVSDTVPKLDHTFGDRVLEGGVYYYICLVCNTKEVSSDQCGHDKDNYEKVATLKVSTCMEKGSARYQCPLCKQTEVRDLPFADHRLIADNIVTKEPTCTTAGVRASECSVCRDLVTESIPALGHDYSEWYVLKEASCVTKGQEARSCSRCFTSETREIVNGGHKYTSWNVSKAPTCVEKGVETRTCINCTEKENRELAYAAHTYGAWTVTKPATCVALGEETHTCSFCAKTENRVLAVDANAHKYGDWTTVVSKTCITDGQKSHTCELCNKVETEVDACTGHVFGETVVEGKTSVKTCGVCGYSEVVKTVKDGVEKTLNAAPASLTIVGAEASKQYFFEFGTPTAADKKLYEEYMPQKGIYSFYDAYTVKTLLDGNEVAANNSMTLKINTTLADYEVAVYRIVDGQYWIVPNVEKDGAELILSGTDIANADALVIARGEKTPANFAVPIIVTIIVLVVAGAAIAIFMSKGKKKSF